MEDAELEITDDIQNPEPDSEETAPTPKPLFIAPIFGLLFLTVALFALFTKTDANYDGQNFGPSEAVLSYQSLSNEQHTGLRLARLDDFLASYPDASLMSSVRARRDALKFHEEKAWAQLTDTFYSTEADEAVRSQAIKAYTDIWTPLHRPEQLKTLSQVLPNDAVPNFDPSRRKSRFASGGNDKFLEGGPVVRIPLPDRTISQNNTNTRRTAPRTEDPRIRGKARRPAYPRSAKRRRIEADVVLALDIDDRGRVARVHVVSVNARRYADDFVKEARRAARRTRFYPKKINGRPVSTSGHIQKYAFRNSR